MRDSAAGHSTARQLLLLLECSAIFAGIPLLIYYRVLPILPIPYLLFSALAVFFYLRRDAAFERSRLFTWKNMRPYLPAMLLRDALLLVVLGVGVRLFAPELLFSFGKRAPGFRAVVMVLYPLVSVYPQELLYRAFFFHRYQPLFASGWAMMVVSALAFGFVHIIFGEWLAVALCVLGGFLFSFTYYRSGSLLLACLDHAIFGEFIFTVGLGQFFYHGSRF